ncbi:unnamed protein product [Meganyctiphanes norvegica]|uniref:CHK kinase-like domain-containing protein n=1 Tax=Meganyctiphanes norvegica TaxID=48144 RepID=A0AAV2QA92_MEGNR
MMSRLHMTSILKKILKISLGSVIALITTGGLLIAKKVYEDEEDPVSPENMTAPGRRSDINKEWVEFMLTDYENRQNPGTKVTVNTFEVGDATQKGDGYAGDHIKLLVNATIQNDADKEQSGFIYDKEYNLFIKLLNPHPIMQQMMKYNKNDLKELLLYSDIMEDFQKFQASKTNENVCMNTPNFIYGKWTNKQFVLVLENMKPHGYGQNPRENSLNLHQTKLGLEQFARLHAVSFAYNKETNLIDKYPSYDISAIKVLFVVGYEKLLDACILYLKGKEGNEELVKKMSSTKSKLVKKAGLEDLFNDSKIKCLIHGDCWNNNFLFKKDFDENGHDFYTNSEKMLVLDFQVLHWNTPIFDICMFIYINTTPQFRKDHLKEILIYYHSTFTDILTKLNCEEPSWTYEQFKSEYDRVFPWYLRFGLASAMIHSETMKEMTLGKSDPGPSGPMWTKIKAAAAKLVIPLILHPVICELTMGNIFNPLIKELLEDKNRQFCDRMLEVLLEAEEIGIFDESRY